MAKKFYMGEYSIELISDILTITEQAVIILSPYYIVEQDDCNEFKVVFHATEGLLDKQEAKLIINEYRDFIFSAEKEILQEYCNAYKNHLNFYYNSEDDIRVVVYKQYEELKKTKKVKILAIPLFRTYIVKLN